MIKHHVASILNRFRRPVTQTFSNQVVVIDNRRYEACTFLNCEIVYGGGSLDVTNSNFNGCTFSMYGKAANALRFMQHLPREVIDQTFNIVRQVTPPGVTKH